MRRQCEWWWAVCGGQYDWREADMVLTIQASCRPEDTWVFKAHVPPAGAFDNTIVTFEAFSELAGKVRNSRRSFMKAARGAAGGR